MKVQKRWMRRLIWMGITGVAGILAGVAAPSSRAQEVNPDHFTATGIDGMHGQETSQKVVASGKANPQGMARNQAKAQNAVASGRRASKAGRREVVLTSAKSSSEKRKQIPEQH